MRVLNLHTEKGIFALQLPVSNLANPETLDYTGGTDVGIVGEWLELPKRCVACETFCPFDLRQLLNCHIVRLDRYV